MFEEMKIIKTTKITKWFHAYKGFSSTYNNEIFSYVNHKLHLKDTHSAIKSKQKKNQLKWIGLNS